MKDVWESCAPQHPSWTTQDSGGDLPGQSYTRADALRKQRPVNPANGPTVGSIGILASSTHTRRTPC